MNQVLIVHEDEQIKKMLMTALHAARSIQKQIVCVDTILQAENLIQELVPDLLIIDAPDQEELQDLLQFIHLKKSQVQTILLMQPDQDLNTYQNCFSEFIPRVLFYPLRQEHTVQTLQEALILCEFYNQNQTYPCLNHQEETGPKAINNRDERAISKPFELLGEAGKDAAKRVQAHLESMNLHFGYGEIVLLQDHTQLDWLFSIKVHKESKLQRFYANTPYGIAVLYFHSEAALTWNQYVEGRQRLYMLSPFGEYFPLGCVGFSAAGLIRSWKQAVAAAGQIHAAGTRKKEEYLSYSEMADFMEAGLMVSLLTRSQESLDFLYKLYLDAAMPLTNEQLPEYTHLVCKSMLDRLSCAFNLKESEHKDLIVKSRELYDRHGMGIESFVWILLTQAERLLEEKRQETRIGYLISLFSDMERHYTHPDYSLEQLSEAVSLSEGYILRLLKKRTGRTFSQSLAFLRVFHGTFYLQRGIAPKQAAGLCGFASSSYFGRQFKSIWHLTPSRYQSFFPLPEGLTYSIFEK